MLLLMKSNIFMVVKECREKNAHLSVVYKSKYAEVLKEREKEDRKKEWGHFFPT